MPASIFAGSKVKTLKDTLTLNGKSDIISSTVDPTASAVDAPIGSLLINQTSGKLYRKLDAGSSVNWEEVGSGTGGINYILNPSAEVNTTGWSTYADAAGAAPVDGTGGSPNVTWTRSTSSPLRGVADFNFAKDAANRQGQGVSVDFTIDEADKAKVLSVTFDYEVLSGTYADADLTVYLIADPTGTPVVIQPAGYTVQAATVGTTMRQIATFQTQATGLSYRLCFHVASTSASAYTLAVDNVVVGPQQTVYGSPVTDWVSYTPVMTGGTASAISGRWRRVGDSIHARVVATLSAGGIYTISAPFPTESSKFPNNAINIIYGTATYYDSSGNVSYSGGPYFSSSTTVRFYGPANTEWSATTPVAFGVGDIISVDIVYPAAGLSSSVQMSQDTDTRVIAASVYRSVANQSVSGSSDVKIQWNGKNNDSTASFDSTTNYRWTNPVSGIIKGSGFIGINATAASAVILVNLYKNGSPVKTIGLMSSSASTSTSIPFSFQIALNAGDYLEMYVNPSGQTIAIQGDSTIYNGSQWNIERLSGPATIAASETVAARYYTTAGNPVTNNAVNYIDFATKDYDTHGMASGTGSGNVLVTNTGFKVTIPISGKYAISVSTISATGGGWAVNEIWETGVMRNGSDIQMGLNASQATHNTYMSSHLYIVANLIAGDRIEPRLFQNSGATLNMLAAAPGLNNFSIVRVGN
jgi:hypothetical protein